MKKKTISAIIAAALALTLTGCGKDDNKTSAPALSSNGTISAASAAGTPTSSASAPQDEESDEAPSDDENGGEEGDKDSLAGRHIYRSVAFYGHLNQMYNWSGMDAEGCIIPYDYSAVVLDYDTANGSIDRIRIVVWYMGSDQSPEDEAFQKRRAIEGAGARLSSMPYSEDSFIHNSDGALPTKICTLTWALEPSEELVYEFAQGIGNYFLVNDAYRENPEFTVQDIDGYIGFAFYNGINWSYEQNYKGLTPIFGDRFFSYDGPNSTYDVAWYDEPWNVKLYDPINDINLNGMSAPEAGSWTPADYGSTSYNTGGGYTGQYNYKDYLHKE